jgi:DNA-binding response OmpR family regulator
VSALILVAEDDENQAELVRRYLEQDDHTVVVAADGRAALDEARRHRLALVVLDLMLPKVHGLDGGNARPPHLTRCSARAGSSSTRSGTW